MSPPDQLSADHGQLQENINRYGLLIARLQARLNALSTQQEEVGAAREQLLVEREDGAMNRKTIRAQRVRTGDTEITLMNAFRKHFKQLARPLPEDLLTAYDRVEKQHSELRRLEEENLQAEEDLGASEWKFSELETDLYQYHISQLLSEQLNIDSAENMDTGIDIGNSAISKDSIPPTRRIQYQVLVAEHDRLIKRFDALRKQQSIRMDTFMELGDDAYQLSEDAQLDDQATQLASELLYLIANCEAKLQQIRPSLEPDNGPAFGRKRQVSEPDFGHGIWFEQVHVPSRAHSEGTVTPSEDTIPQEEQIGNWSLQSLKSSALEKLQYLNILRPKLMSFNARKLDFEQWEPHITRQWVSDQVEAPIWPSWDLPVDTRNTSEQVKMASLRPLRNERNKPSCWSESSRLEQYSNCGADVGSHLAPNMLGSTETSAPPCLVDFAPVGELGYVLDEDKEQTAGMPTALPARLGSPLEVALEAAVQGKPQGVSTEASLITGHPDPGAQPLIRCDSAQGSAMRKSPVPILSETDHHVMPGGIVKMCENGDSSLFPFVSRVAISAAQFIRVPWEWPSVLRLDQYNNVETADNVVESFVSEHRDIELRKSLRSNALFPGPKEQTKKENRNSAHKSELMPHNPVCSIPQKVFKLPELRLVLLISDDYVGLSRDSRRKRAMPPVTDTQSCLVLVKTGDSYDLCIPVSGIKVQVYAGRIQLHQTSESRTHPILNVSILNAYHRSDLLCAFRFLTGEIESYSSKRMLTAEEHTTSNSQFWYALWIW